MDEYSVDVLLDHPNQDDKDEPIVIIDAIPVETNLSVVGRPRTIAY